VSDIALIGLDWGSTNLRAFAFAADGSVTARRHSDAGALTLSGTAAFDAALTALVGDWALANADVPMVACGMVGARSGWQEAPYVETGADAAALAGGVVRVDTALGRTLAIIPGMKSDEPDVMRGEETQLIGAGVSDGIVVLPGTHCKWVRMADGRVDSFASFFTGEMHAMIRDHSSVGKAITSKPDLHDRASFDMGIAYARAGAASWLHDLFVLRASVVTGQKSEAAVSTVLAGWLLGCEFAAALAMYPQTRGIVTIASESLVPWYQSAARAFAIAFDALNAEAATTNGLWRIARLLR
jgi:2-dehydro-3-deoxygalactonokinase